MADDPDDAPMEEAMEEEPEEIAPPPKEEAQSRKSTDEESAQGCGPSGSAKPCSYKPKKRKRSYIWGPPKPLFEEPAYLPCPHIYFKNLKENVKRDGLSRDDWMDILSTPNPTPWVKKGEHGEKLVRYRRKRCSKRTKQLAIPRIALVRANWEEYKGILNENMLERLRQILADDFHMTPEEIKEFIKRGKKSVMPPKRKKKKKKRQPSIPAVELTDEEWMRSMLTEVASRAVDTSEYERPSAPSGRLEMMISTILERLAALAGEPPPPRNATGLIARLMIVIAEKLACWIESVVCEADKVPDDKPCSARGIDFLSMLFCSPNCETVKRIKAAGPCGKAAASKRHHKRKHSKSKSPEPVTCCGMKIREVVEEEQEPPPPPAAKYPECKCACMCVQPRKRRRKKGKKKKKVGKKKSGHSEEEEEEEEEVHDLEGGDGEGGDGKGGDGEGESEGEGGGGGGTEDQDGEATDDANAGAAEGDGEGGEGGEGGNADAGAEGGGEDGGEGEGGGEEQKGGGSGTIGSKKSSNDSPTKPGSSKSSANAAGSKSSTNASPSKSNTGGASKTSADKSKSTTSAAASKSSANAGSPGGSKSKTSASASKTSAGGAGGASKSSTNAAGSKSSTNAGGGSKSSTNAASNKSKSSTDAAKSKTSVKSAESKASAKSKTEDGDQEYKVTPDEDGVLTVEPQPTADDTNAGEDTEGDLEAKISELGATVAEEAIEEGVANAAEGDLPPATFGSILDHLAEMIEDVPEDAEKSERRDKLAHTLEDKFKEIVENDSKHSPEGMDNVVTDVASKVANWMDTVIREAEARRASDGTTVGVAGEVASMEVREWAEWIVGVMGIAEDWAGWITKTVAAAEEKSRIKKGEARTSTGEIKKLTKAEWREWKQIVRQRATDFQARKQSIKQAAADWEKRTKGKKVIPSNAPTTSNNALENEEEEEQKVTDIDATSEKKGTPDSQEGEEES